MKRNGCGLSKNLLQMKFMQKSKENYEVEQRERASYGQQSQELLKLCQEEGDKFLATNSFIFCENLQYGRMSFKGMNPEIEQLMRLKNPIAASEQEIKTEPEADISDNEMVKIFKKRKSK